MKIAILAPSPVPFVIGGAEKLWWGLLGQFNKMPGIQADLIKIPCPERSFSELVSSYRTFYALDLLHFDAVISTKYPAWMIQHPNHVVYLQHRLRGLYDTYKFCNKPIEIPSHLLFDLRLKKLFYLLQQEPITANVIGLFDELDRLKEILDQDFDRVFEFPGPLTRSVVRFLDNSSLRIKVSRESRSGITNFAAISKNVKSRVDYFPAGSKVTVIHHPSDLPVPFSKPPEHIFSVSRLDNSKRIDLLIQAYKSVKSDLPFLIAGAGPEEGKLRELAKGDSRIRFLGRLSDLEILEFYEKSLFVPFVPYDEDYGLITIEAMLASKAVLTTLDAGGVNEFVENGVSGLSVEPTVNAIACAMQELVSHPTKALEMGKRALEKVSHISWENTCVNLLSLIQGDLPSEPIFDLHTPRVPWVGSIFEPVQKRKKVLVVCPFRVIPSESGGQARVYNLYLALSKQFDVTILSVGEWQQDFSETQVTPYFREIVVPINKEARLHFEAMHRALQVDCSDLAMIDGILFHREFLIRLRDLAQQSFCVVASHPYLYKAIEATHRGRVVYDAHNVEFDMKTAVLKASPNQILAHSLLDTTFRLEKKLVTRCCVLAACSQQDLDRFFELHPEMPRGAQYVVPNGVDISGARFQKLAVKASLQSPFTHHASLLKQNQIHKNGIKAKEIALFTGSWHGPNIKAMHLVVELARKAPDVLFLVIGTVSLHPDFKNLPENILPLGRVTEFEKQVILDAATLMLNPMEEGSGTNLKMLEYAACGANIISTEFGNRGLAFLPEKEIITCSTEHLLDAISHVRSMSLESRQAMASMARLRVETNYDWPICAQPLIRAFHLMLA